MENNIFLRYSEQRLDHSASRRNKMELKFLSANTDRNECAQNFSSSFSRVMESHKRLIQRTNDLNDQALKRKNVLQSSPNFHFINEINKLQKISKSLKKIETNKVKNRNVNETEHTTFNLKFNMKSPNEENINEVYTNENKNDENHNQNYIIQQFVSKMGFDKTRTYFEKKKRLRNFSSKCGRFPSIYNFLDIHFNKALDNDQLVSMNIEKNNLNTNNCKNKNKNENININYQQKVNHSFYPNNQEMIVK